MTPEQLLELKIHGNTTLRSIFYGALEDGTFGVDVTLYSAAEERAFYLKLTQKIIDERNKHETLL